MNSAASPWREACVTHCEPLGPEVRLLRLAAIGAATLPRFSAGSHIQMELPLPDGTRRNAYSLINDPADVSCYEIAVCRRSQGRGGSVFLHEAVRPGMRLRFLGPNNLFPLVRPARRHLMFAGGIGVTPFIGLMAALAARGAEFELHFALRSEAWLAWGQALQGRFGSAVHLYNGGAGERLDPARLVQGQPLGTHLYICGPERLLASTREAAHLAGWPAACMHSEHFTGSETGEAFAVQAGREGPQLTVGPEESLLEALERVGFRPPNLCRGGVLVANAKPACWQQRGGSSTVIIG